MLPAIWGLFIYCMVETKGNIGLGHLSNTSSAKTNGWGWFFGKSYLVVLINVQLLMLPQ
jgi:nucleobase:cation symporter-1, NCS1 family